MDEAGFKYEIKQEVDGQGSKETSLKMAQDALTANPDVNVIFGINDNSTTGGMAAYKEAGLDESNLTAIGLALRAWWAGKRSSAAAPTKRRFAMFPDYMGAHLIDAAYKAYNGEEPADEL
jgi:ABC-type sugar transport system substrate-binding protein